MRTRKIRVGKPAFDAFARMAHVQGAFRQAARRPQRRDGVDRGAAQRRSTTAAPLHLPCAQSFDGAGAIISWNELRESTPGRRQPHGASGCGPETSGSGFHEAAGIARDHPAFEHLGCPLVAGRVVITKSPSAAATARRTRDSLVRVPSARRRARPAFAFAQGSGRSGAHRPERVALQRRRQAATAAGSGISARARAASTRSTQVRGLQLSLPQGARLLQLDALQQPRRRDRR